MAAQLQQFQYSTLKSIFNSNRTNKVPRSQTSITTSLDSSILQFKNQNIYQLKSIEMIIARDSTQILKVDDFRNCVFSL